MKINTRDKIIHAIYVVVLVYIVGAFSLLFIFGFSWPVTTLTEKFLYVVFGPIAIVLLEVVVGRLFSPLFNSKNLERMSSSSRVFYGVFVLSSLFAVVGGLIYWLG